MCLGHAYIVLEPVGSARLTFGDDWYYEFMCFDVPKIVQSPGCDHGHDEESQNGRDIKIHILDDYIQTPDEFRGSPDNYRSARGLPEHLGELMGQHGPCKREVGAIGLPPPWESELDKEGGVAPPLSLPLSSFLPPSSS